MGNQLFHRKLQEPHFRHFRATGNSNLDLIFVFGETVVIGVPHFGLKPVSTDRPPETMQDAAKISSVDQS